MSIKTALKRAWMFTSITSVCAVGAYFYGLSGNSFQYPFFEKDNSEEYERRINEMRLRINNMSKDNMSAYDRYLISAIKKYGLDNIVIFAQNGRYECPSGTSSKKLRCDVREEIAVMYATLNLFNSGNYGASLRETIEYKHNSGAYLFSWIPDIDQRDNTSDAYNHSLMLAVNVLGGNPEYEKYNIGQKYYCRHSISPCSWHKSAKAKGTLIETGRLVLRDPDDHSDWITSSNLSYHTFYKTSE